MRRAEMHSMIQKKKKHESSPANLSCVKMGSAVVVAAKGGPQGVLRWRTATAHQRAQLRNDDDDKDKSVDRHSHTLAGIAEQVTLQTGSLGRVCPPLAFWCKMPQR